MALNLPHFGKVAGVLDMHLEVICVVVNPRLNSAGQVFRTWTENAELRRNRATGRYCQSTRQRNVGRPVRKQEK